MSSSAPRTTSTSSSAAARSSEVRQEILRQLSEAHAHMNQIMLDAISVAQQVFEGGGEDQLEYVIKGETNLMGVAELTNVEKLRRLFEAFNEKRDFLHLLDHSLKAERVQIFIGHESGYQILDDCSVVTAPYADGDGGGRGARGHRPHPHGLRTGHPDRRHDG